MAKTKALANATACENKAQPAYPTNQPTNEPTNKQTNKQTNQPTNKQTQINSDIINK
jgi:hypothetical protein